MNFISILFGAIKNDFVNERLVTFANQTIDYLVADNLKNTSDFLSLKDKNLYFCIEDLNLTYKAEIADKISVKKVDHIENSDLLITAKQSAVLSLINRQEDFEELIKENKLSIEGDNKYLINILNLSSRVDLSAENILSYYIGDVPAHLISKAGQHINRTVNNLVTFINDSNLNSYSNKSQDEFNNDPFRDDSIKDNKTNGSLLAGIENKLPNIKLVLDDLLKQIKKN
ncbi:SCP2 sterol-binding domain-containing protein [Psittacicella hinzii]|uniref:SCP2 sterol-binding domain-containing protein n=1 Tax=Psittacicella hinzii TaxID=2028575 RepID=UPI001CA69D24|nr:SCP2 sterol-binding domain-containing protein [Psittacicella hinzii]